MPWELAPRTSIRDVEVISAFLCRKFGARFLGYGPAKLRLASFEFARGFVGIIGDFLIGIGLYRGESITDMPDFWDYSLPSFSKLSCEILN